MHRKLNRAYYAVTIASTVTIVYKYLNVIVRIHLQIEWPTNKNGTMIDTNRYSHSLIFKFVYSFVCHQLARLVRCKCVYYSSFVGRQYAHSFIKEVGLKVTTKNIKTYLIILFVPVVVVFSSSVSSLVVIFTLSSVNSHRDFFIGIQRFFFFLIYLQLAFNVSFYQCHWLRIMSSLFWKSSFHIYWKHHQSNQTLKYKWNFHSHQFHCTLSFRTATHKVPHLAFNS